MEIPKRLFDFAFYQLEKKPLKCMITSRVAGEWKSYSTEEFVNDVNAISRGLLRMNVQPGHKIALISHNNRAEWNVMDHGILQIGAIDVPVYPTMTTDDFVYIFNHAEIEHCFVSSAELFQKVSSIKDKVPSLKEIFTFEEVEGAKNWKDILDLGRDDSNQNEVQSIKDGIDENDLATLIYTSGTTGIPKGVMLTHKNIACNAIRSSERLPKVPEDEPHSLSFLPICHIYERMMHYLYMYKSVRFYCADSLETIKEDLVLSKPYAFTAVPRLLEKFYDGILAKGTSAGGLKSAIFQWAVGLALKWEPYGNNGFWYEKKLSIADKLVFSKIREALGLTRIQAVSSGSAALQPRLARFFSGIGVPVYEGYGLTETSPVISVNTLNSPDMYRIGTVGKPLPETEVKIADDGEILCKGPQVMIGYYKNEEMTNEVLKDGWFHTGDIGVIEDGFLKITDRKKEIFKTSGGKYISPQILENALKECLYIEQAIVVGENQKFPAALIVLNTVAVKEWMSRHNIKSVGNIGENEEVIKRVWKDINEINQRFGKWEQIKMIEILDKPFTIESGELTPTMKLKRKPIHSKYKDIIDGIYD